MSGLVDWITGDDAPTPPNPIATAAGQTSTNVASGVANAFLNQANQVTPQGNLTYSASTSPETGSYSWNDPVTGVTYQIPRFTVTQSGPAVGTPEHEVYWRNQASKYNLAEASKTASFRLMEMLGQRPDMLAGAPPAGDINSLNVGDPRTWYGDVGGQQRSIDGYGQQQTGFGDTGWQQTGWFGDTGQQQTGFGDAGNITRGYGPADNFSADRGRVEEALYGRLNPQLEKDRARVEQQLADQGIRYGSPAYKQAMDDYNRQSTDARLAVTAAGGQEQQRMMDMAAQEAGFQNAAQQQAYLQAQGRGTFANTAQQKAYEQALGRGQFANQAQQTLFEQLRARGAFANEAQAQQYAQTLGAGQFANQAQTQAYQQEALRAQFQNAGLAQQLSQNQTAFNAQNALRNQYIAEQNYARNQPFNEINAVMAGGQLSAPSWVGTPTSNIATTDVAGLINNRFSQDMGIYQQNSANMNALIGGILGAGGKIGAAALSDRREKENIERVGTVFAAGDDGKKPLPVYEFEYKKDIDPSGTRRVGPMAQDVEKIDRDAVINRGGRKYLNTTKLGSILKVA